MATREDVYAKFGVTAEAAQLFETEIGTMVLALEGGKREWHLSPDPEQAADFYEKLNRKTLGQLLHELRKYADPPEGIDLSFDQALDARNQLNHGFFLSHNFEIYSEEARDLMVAELEIMHSRLFAAYEIAQTAASQLVGGLKAAQASGDVK